MCANTFLILSLRTSGSASIQPMMRSMVEQGQEAFKALKFSLGKFIRSFFKMLFFTLTFNKKQKINYLYRFLGLLNSMIGKKSHYRIED